MKDYKTLDQLAYWFETEYIKLPKEERKNLLIYECLSLEKIEKYVEPVDKNKATNGVLISRFLKKLVNPEKEDEKALIFARFKSLKNIENTVNTIVEDNKEYFQKFLCKENQNYLCCEKDGYGQENVRKTLIYRIFSFYLSRYSFLSALKFSLLADKRLLFYLYLPRLLGSILASSILVITASEIWVFISKLQGALYILSTVLFSFLYIVLLDMKNIVPQINLINKVLRAFPVIFIGLLESYMFAFLLANIQRKKNFLEKSIYINLEYILSLAATILLIGIIMNIFWQKETIPKPI